MEQNGRSHAQERPVQASLSSPANCYRGKLHNIDEGKFRSAFRIYVVALCAPILYSDTEA